MAIIHDPEIMPIDHLANRGRTDDPALILRDRDMSYGELRDQIGRMAAWLHANIGAPGARIASWAAKGELTCLLPLAAARAGLVHVPINPLLKHRQVAHILADSGATMLIANRSRMDTLDREDVPDECQMILEPDALDACTRQTDGLPPSRHDPQQLAAILYTSGSTGQPKGVMLSHANLWLGAASVAEYLGLADDDVTLAVLPFSFDYGQNQLFSSWYAGAAVVPLDYLFPRDVMKACLKHRITTLAAVPPLWVQLAELDWDPQAISAMRRLTNSGGALSRQLVGDLRAIFPDASLYPMYGLTEAFRSTYLDPQLVDDYPTSIGRAIPHAEILVINDAGQPAAPGEEGELVHCGPLVAQGYWRDREKTAARFRPAPAVSQYGGLAVWSGDRVRQDGNGLLYFVGRRDAMIKSQGNRISPQEVEDAALASGLVAEAVAFGISDDRAGQVVHLAVRPLAGQSEDGAEGRANYSQDHNPDHSDRLRKYLARELPNFMQPKMIHWCETMPINANGKLDRGRLIRELSE